MAARSWDATYGMDTDNPDASKIAIFINNAAFRSRGILDNHLGQTKRPFTHRRSVFPQRSHVIDARILVKWSDYCIIMPTRRSRRMTRIALICLMAILSVYVYNFSVCFSRYSRNSLLRCAALFQHYPLNRYGWSQMDCFPLMNLAYDKTLRGW